MGESVAQLPKGGLVRMVVPEARNDFLDRQVGAAEGGGWMHTPGFGIQSERSVSQL